MNSKPWVPIVGEFHYSRMPQGEWRDALMKMKAGGINAVASYVFWIHHEEIRGQFDWSGQRSLREFLKLCAELELKAIVRMGPWCHGEARNGGFPDWVQQSGTGLRSMDPAYLDLVKPLYHEIAQQMLGLLWKDGGPVIGVQLENECANPPYLLALKAMARMPAFFPDKIPADLNDFATLRWSVRSDGQAGFVFFSNQQPSVPLPDHTGVQFALKTPTGTVTFPRKPITIPSGSYGIFPVNLNCDGVVLSSATVQPICRIQDGKDKVTYFFTALAGIEPELVVNTAEGESVITPTPGTSPSVNQIGTDGIKVSFVVLAPEAALHFWRMPFSGRDRAILSLATVMSDKGDLRVQATNRNNLTLAMFPVDDIPRTGENDGVFKRFTGKEVSPLGPLQVIATQEKPPGALAGSMKGTDEATWKDAAVYQLQIPAEAEGRRLILDLHYIGDAARLYVGDRLVFDHFYNGDPFAIALWRIPASDWPNIRVKILSYSEELAARLPPEAIAKVAEAKAASTLDKITVTLSETNETQFSQP